MSTRLDPAGDVGGALPSGARSDPRDKTIHVLLAAAQRRQADLNSSFGELFKGAALQEAVRRKTAELAEAGEQIRMMERSLADSQRLESIGRLAAGIAHEINTPTQYVGDNLGFIEQQVDTLLGLCRAMKEVLAAAGPAGVDSSVLAHVEQQLAALDLEFLEAELPSAVRQSIDGMERIAAIVRAMKEFSHPGTQTKVPININHALESTLTVGRSEWKYVASLETHFEPDLPTLDCFPGDLNQVFLNILVNAAHAIGDRLNQDRSIPGRIRVTTRRVNDWIEVHFEDNGCGIPEENLKRIFEPFFTTKGIGKGTGQGLSLAYAVVVQKHGGQLDVRSKVGQGSTFILRLPLVEPPSPSDEAQL